MIEKKKVECVFAPSYACNKNKSLYGGYENLLRIVDLLGPISDLIDDTVDAVAKIFALRTVI